MVRSAFGEWHVPKDFRIVWRPDTPTGDLDAALQARDRRDAQARAATPEPPAAKADIAPAGRLSDDRSPFDFSDFDRVAATAKSAGERQESSPVRSALPRALK
ncbi:hypothetical protein D1610_04330 [Sphingomonas gilva]|uniref:Uncharacterized protein n=2 Tax=Sphingomonas gilva TaxID=2305907 RepID=A0A396S7G2_9SPHN|nr:hypothetical protein D1610_04330 [Sphingomonas gilva]